MDHMPDVGSVAAAVLFARLHCLLICVLCARFAVVLSALVCPLSACPSCFARPAARLFPRRPTTWVFALHSTLPSPPLWTSTDSIVALLSSRRSCPHSDQILPIFIRNVHSRPSSRSQAGARGRQGRARGCAAPQAHDRYDSGERCGSFGRTGETDSRPTSRRPSGRLRAATLTRRLLLAVTSSR
jgi:hypothetical protein